jgi:hypothetical protein
LFFVAFMKNVDVCRKRLFSIHRRHFIFARFCWSFLICND